MTRFARIATVVVASAAALLGVWLALPLWLPAVAGASMPPGWSLSELALAKGAWGLPAIRRAEIRGAGCRLLLLEQLELTLRWDGLIPRAGRVRVESMEIEPACRPQGDAEAAGRSPTALPGLPRGARLEVNRLTVAGWLSHPHRLAADTADGRLRLEIAGPSLDADAAWDPDARRGRVELRRLWVAGGAAPATGGLEADGAMDLGPAEEAGRSTLTGRVGLRLPSRVELDMTITGRLDVASAEAPGLSLATQMVGTVPPVDGRLDGELAIGWRDGAVTVSSMRLGLDQAVTPWLVALRPELRLAAPVVLQPRDPRLLADVDLAAASVNIVDGGRLEAPQARVRLDGESSGIDWELRATAGGGLGPLTGSGRGGPEGFAGRVRLEDLALPALQALLPPSSPLGLQAGTASADLALQWKPGDAGPRAEGQGAVSAARVALTHGVGVADGIDARVALALADGVWRVKRERPATIAVARIEAAVPAEGGRARVWGAWPYRAGDPLRVEGLRLGCLGGEIALDALSLPPPAKPVTLALRGIRLEQISALYGDRTVSLSGTLDGDLPLRPSRDGWTVEGGVLRNRSPVRIRLSDADALAAFKQANPGLADAADWLSDLEVGRLDATLDLQADGTLVVVATIEGHNPQRGDRPVRLNYRHEENLFQLLQSLRIGSDLGRDIEQRLSPQQRSRQ